MRRWAPLIAAVIGGVVVGGIAYFYAGADIGVHRGAGRFVGMAAGLGVIVPFLVASRLTRGAPVTRDGFTLSFPAIAPTAAGYRESGVLTVDALLAALRATGYQPSAEVCDELGTRRGPAETGMPLAGANIAIRDAGVRGWIRIQLAPTLEGRARSLGVLEMWSERGESTEELALFTMRALDQLLGGVTAARESSRLGEDPAALLAAGLGERPVHRA